MTTKYAPLSPREFKIFNRMAEQMQMLVPTLSETKVNTANTILSSTNGSKLDGMSSMR